MKKYTFQIHELAERAGTTIRTIRYYTDEGLLPQPLIQGKYAYYNEAHLNRLELIRRMKDAFLPLRHIKEVMVALSDEDVRQRLGEQVQKYIPAEESALPLPPGEGNNALEYINRVMENQAEFRPRPKMGAPLQEAAPLMAQKVSEPAPARMEARPAPEPATENWQRIILAPGVELHLRLQHHYKFEDSIIRLIEFAKTLFKES